MIDPNDTTRWLAKLDSQTPSSGRQIAEDGSLVNVADDIHNSVGLAGARVLERFDSITGWGYIPGFGSAVDTVEVVTGVVANALKFTKVSNDNKNLAFYKYFEDGPIDFTPYIGGTLTIFGEFTGSNVEDIRIFLPSIPVNEGFRGIGLAGLATRLDSGKLQSITISIPDSFSTSDGPDLEHIVGIAVAVGTFADGDDASVTFDHATVSKPSTTRVLGETARYTSPVIALVGKHSIVSADAQQRSILKGLGITNNTAAALYIQIFASGDADAVTPGTTIPDYVVKVDASQHVNAPFPSWSSPEGFVFFPSTTPGGAIAPATPPDIYPLYDLS